MGLINSKWAHFLSALLVSLVAVVMVGKQPDLTKDSSAWLGTIGFFIGAYGLIFAVIEVLRLKGATRLASAEAKRVFNVITNLATAREVIECQNTIQVAVAAVDEGNVIPSSALCQIVKLYSQVFHEELSNDQSEHRKNRSVLNSYRHNKTPKKSFPHKTKEALLSISGQLGQLQGSTKNFSEEI